jgi:hypothetical protein
MLEYVLLTFITCVIIIFIFIRLKYKFWYYQPVFHYYDFFYWFNSPRIIRKELPTKNKYTNFKKIYFLSFNEMNQNSKQLKEFVYLIQENYLKNKENHFNPLSENIIPYFKNHFAESYFSFYYEDILLEDIKNKIIISDKKLIGVMTTRPLHAFIKNKLLDVYYMDYLCIDKMHRKNNIGPQLIQTHEYLQSHSNKKIAVSLFKREGDITGIVPICLYKTYCFQMHKWIKPLSLSNETILLKGDSENLYYLYNFIVDYKQKWDIYVIPEISNLIELAQTKNIYIYMIMIENEIKAVYFFRKVCTSINKGKEVISLFASIKGNIDENIFITGFKVSLSKIIQEYKYFYYLCVEDISHNNKIINNLLIKSIPMYIYSNAYFFYNFIYHTCSSNKILMIN